MTNLYVFGDSHVGALLASSRVLSEQLTERDLQPEFYVRTCANWIDFELTELNGTFHAFCNIVPGDSSVDYRATDRSGIYVFSSPLFSGLTYVQDTWRYGCPWQCSATNPDLYGISSAAIEAYIDNQLRCRLDFILRLKSAGFQIAVVEPPKPLQRTPALFGFRPDILVAVDQIHRQHAIRRLRENDIPIISVPDDTPKDGFTVDEYAVDDPTDTHHGNQKFGVRMLEQVMRFASANRHIPPVSSGSA